ncbi:MAG: cell division protein ZapB [Treponema sp.]|jgi:predicted nuclease with TOPRIM domain|nr:cell division protein ZapB [Treponema sp.]
MISLEQVELLESRVAKAIEYVRKVTAENAALVSEKAGLQARLESNQKRIDELEVLVMRFKEDQGRIEDGILAALDRLNQFEDAFEKSLNEKKNTKKPAAKSAVKDTEKPVSAAAPSKEIFFEIPKKEAPDDDLDGDSSAEGELDIF